MIPLRRIATGVLALSTLTAVAACGGADTDTDSDAGSSAGGGPEAITISILDGNITSSTLVLAEENGYFDDAGLDVTLEPVQAPALVPSVVGGASQFAFLNAPATLVARANNVPIVAVSGISTMPAEADAAPLAVVAPGGSGIASPEDLEGKTVAVDTLYQWPHLGTLNALESEGVDTSTIEFVEVPFPQMLDAVKEGQADAATVIEPFLGAALAGGNETVVSLATGQESWPIGVIVTSEQYAGQNSAVIEKLQQAIEAASTYASEHPDELRALIPTFTQVPAAAAENIRLYDWTAEYGEGWDGWAQILEEQSVVEGDIDADAAHQ